MHRMHNMVMQLEREIPLAVKVKMGLAEAEKVHCSVMVIKEFKDVLTKNAMELSMAINIGLEMFLRSKGLWPPRK